MLALGQWSLSVIWHLYLAFPKENLSKWFWNFISAASVWWLLCALNLHKQRNKDTGQAHPWPWTGAVADLHLPSVLLQPLGASHLHPISHQTSCKSSPPVLLVHSYTTLLHNNIQRKASVHLLRWPVLLVLYFCFRHNSQNLVLGKCRTWEKLQSTSAAGNLSVIPRVGLCPGVLSCRAGYQQPRTHLLQAAPTSLVGSGHDGPQKTALRYSKSSFHYLYSLIRANEY